MARRKINDSLENQLGHLNLAIAGKDWIVKLKSNMYNIL